MQKIALIFIYNIFVTIFFFFFFFQAWTSKQLFDPHVFCRPGWVMVNQHIFKSGLNNTLIAMENKSQQNLLYWILILQSQPRDPIVSCNKIKHLPLIEFSVKSRLLAI